MTDLDKELIVVELSYGEQYPCLEIEEDEEDMSGYWSKYVVRRNLLAEYREAETEVQRLQHLIGKTAVLIVKGERGLT